MEDRITRDQTAAAFSLGTQSRVVLSGLLLSQIGLLAVLFLWLYGSVLGGLVQQWWTQEESSHGFLILPICLLVLWVNRRELKSLPIQPTWRGIPVMGAAGFLLVVSEAGSILVLSQISMLMMLAGLILALLGSRFLAFLRFSLSYLLFMLPSLAAAVLVWNWQFQLITARMGVFFLQLAGIPAQLDQNQIILPNIILNVASSCSGARYLISILAVALPVGYLVLRQLKYRIALVVLALTIGITANWMRVVFIGLWAYSGGKVVHGPFHVFQALSVAWVAFAGLFAAAWALSRMESRGSKQLLTRDEGAQPNTVSGEGLPRTWNPTWARAVLLLLAVITFLGLHDSHPVPLKHPFSALPSKIGVWVQTREDGDAPLFRAEGADEELHRVYVGTRNQRLHLYVAYFESQRQGKEAGGHLMTPFHQSSETVSLGSPQSEQRAGWTFVTNETETWEVLFWYDINARVLSSNLSAKAATIWDALTRRRTNGALVMVYRDQALDTAQDPDPELKGFVLDLLPALREHLP